MLIVMSHSITLQFILTDLIVLAPCQQRCFCFVLWLLDDRGRSQ